MCLLIKHHIYISKENICIVLFMFSFLTIVFLEIALLVIKLINRLYNYKCFINDENDIYKIKLYLFYMFLYHY